MGANSLHLLASRRFLPLFATQCLATINDNLFKNATIVLAIYRIGEMPGRSAQLLIAIGSALFVLPSFLFSATAGELADRYEKAGLLKQVKLAEIPIVALGAAGLYWNSVPLLLFTLFLLGAQAAFFGPLRYAVLPEHLSTSELVGGAGLIDAGTFFATLVGTVAGTLLMLPPHGAAMIAGIMLATALSGFAASLALPRARPGDSAIRVSLNPARALVRVMATIREPRLVRVSVICISWFWTSTLLFVTALPAYAKAVLGVEGAAIMPVLSLFPIGIGIGSMLCAFLPKGEISGRTLPLAGLGMAGFTADLAFDIHTPGRGHLVDIAALLAWGEGWHAFFDLTALAVCGGLFIVPLYAILQSRAAPARKARIMAASNIVNASFMVAASALAALLLWAGLSITHLMGLIALVNLVAAARSMTLAAVGGTGDGGDRFETRLVVAAEPRL